MYQQSPAAAPGTMPSIQTKLNGACMKPDNLAIHAWERAYCFWPVGFLFALGAVTLFASGAYL
jgi:hypothetical protein